MIELRPWGKYEIIYMDNNCKVKKITVSPNQKLSYQYHLKRQERWVITKGILTVVLDDETFIKHPGEGIYIPLGAKHRAWNNTDEIVEFIEVQTGEYFGEDDIVRIEDSYGRA
jgi:mannose-6-phosphate isomerase